VFKRWNKGDELVSEKHKSANRKSVKVPGSANSEKASINHASLLQRSADPVQNARNRPELGNEASARGLADATHARNHRYSNLYEFAPIAYLAIDNKGLIEEINRLGCMLLGAGRDTIIHQPFTNFVHGIDLAYWRQYLKRTKRSVRQQGCELNIRRIDGKEFLASVEGSHVEIGDTAATCIVLADISRRKRKEKETLDWRNEMDELKKMQIASQTAAAIAHELNQPLLAIATYSEAALKLLQAEKPELNKVVKAVGGCERQAQRAGKTIHELLDFLSIKEIHTEAFDLNKAISEVVNAARSEHELQFDSVLLLEEGLPPVFANRSHVEKAIFNLLHNGIEAMHESDVDQPVITVTVCTKFDANAAQVTIRDNGPGVKEENLHQLFKPFFTTKAKGIGMGLAVSRSLIEANGGQLWIDPQEGPGAIFYLTLPFAL
jgi:PAS domain S-box-containing protein